MSKAKKKGKKGTKKAKKGKGDDDLLPKERLIHDHVDYMDTLKQLENEMTSLFWDNEGLWAEWSNWREKQSETTKDYQVLLAHLMYATTKMSK